MRLGRMVERATATGDDRGVVVGTQIVAKVFVVGAVIARVVMHIARKIKPAHA